MWQSKIGRGRPVAPNAEPGRTRHAKCGASYNGYKWGSCPQCHANDTGLCALICASCRNKFFAKQVDHCPECGSGETVLAYSPDEIDDAPF